MPGARGSARLPPPAGHGAPRAPPRMTRRARLRPPAPEPRAPPRGCLDDPPPARRRRPPALDVPAVVTHVHDVPRRQLEHPAHERQRLRQRLAREVCADRTWLELAGSAAREVAE